MYCGSADWMDRNLFRRIEIAFPIEGEELKDRVTDDLKLYLQDDMQAWVLDTDGHYSRSVVDGQVSAQMRLMNLYDERVALTEG
jgi:polyphosphate kinase